MQVSDERASNVKSIFLYADHMLKTDEKKYLVALLRSTLPEEEKNQVEILEAGIKQRRNRTKCQ